MTVFPANSFSPLETRTRVAEVRIRLIYAVLRGQLRPGDRLTESKLASDLGVSQATVNQALQDLHSERIVCKSLNRGTTVSVFGEDDVRQLFSVRAILEPAAASAAAIAVANGAELRPLRMRVDEMKSTARRELGAFCIADYEFHRAIYELSGNAFLISASQAVSAAPFAYILCSQPQPLPTDYEALADAHGQIVDAIARGPEYAEQSMREQVGCWLNLSTKFLKRVSAPSTPACPDDAGPGTQTQVSP